MSYIPLDQAAREVKKSEVTVRRLLKSAKISHQKEKTLTGFIYLVDPAEIKHYYGMEDEQAPLEERPPVVIEAADTDDGDGADATQPAGDGGQEMLSRQIRVAVAGETGNLSEYWQKRAETYEERYNQEMQRESVLREELGLWRGRAEQAQNLVLKLLPASQPVPVEPAKPSLSNQIAYWLLVGLAVVIAILLGGLCAAAYLWWRLHNT